MDFEPYPIHLKPRKTKTLSRLRWILLCTLPPLVFFTVYMRNELAGKTEILSGLTLGRDGSMELKAHQSMIVDGENAVWELKGPGELKATEKPNLFLLHSGVMFLRTKSDSAVFFETRRGRYTLTSGSVRLYAMGGHEVVHILAKSLRREPKFPDETPLELANGQQALISPGKPTQTDKLPEATAWEMETFMEKTSTLSAGQSP